MKLWVDDERLAPDEGWITAPTSITAISFLMINMSDQIEGDGKPFSEVSLDHDLGGEDTGMKVLDYMIKHDIWPKTLTIHTANPPARQQMLRAANAEAPVWVDIYVKTW